MKFKAGDRVTGKYIPEWYNGMVKLNEDYTITKAGRSSNIIWVRSAKGELAPIYKSWVSVPKNQQLLFGFMYEDV